MSNENGIDQKILIGKEMENLFGVTKEQLGRLRTTEGLPYIRVNQRIQLYLEDDVLAWLKQRRYQKGVEIGDNPIS